jgi:2-oxoglutarate ferredoxin oxidoreductase subunit beta
MALDSTTYRDPKVAAPFCKGCGHTHVIRHLDAALVKLHLDPSSVCLVTDIGCIGLADPLFERIHTVHTTHGRSTAFATGITIADDLLGDSKLTTIVLIGDGGATIGLQHLVQAALLNVDVTVLLCNNFLYGMTGGQNSGCTPVDFVTSTTPWGNFVPPMDFVNLMVGCKAGFVEQMAATDRRLGDVMASAITHPGFSIVVIDEVCPEYGAAKNENLNLFIPKHSMSDELPEKFPRTEFQRKEFSESYRSTVMEAAPRKRSRTETVIPQQFEHALAAPVRIVVAGTAGERVQSAAGMLAEAAVRCGLDITRKNDNPVTQGSGFSISELCLSPEPIHFTGVAHPDVIIVVSEDGMREVRANGTLDRASGATVFVLDSELGVSGLPGITHTFPFRKAFGAKQAALAAVAYYVRLTDTIPMVALAEVLKQRSPELGKWLETEFSRALSQ